MGDFGIKKNVSNYYDETAYKGIKSADTPKSGEIWTFAGNEYLIIHNSGKICNVLKLWDNSSFPLTVYSRSVKYADPAWVQFIFTDTAETFIKAVSDTDFKRYKEAIAKALNLTLVSGGVDPAEYQELEDKYSKSRAEVEALNKMLNEKKENKPTSEIPYKRMYEELIDKLIKGVSNG